MSRKKPISTESAPSAIGTYSQAVSIGTASTSLVFLSGQIPLDPSTMTLVEGGIRAQTERVFDNLAAVAAAAGGRVDDFVKLTVYLTDLADFSVVNEVMAERFAEPYPARAAIGISELPKGAAVEVEAIMALDGGGG